MRAETNHLCGLLRAVAAQEIMPRFSNVESSRKADGSLVTEADLGVQQRLTEELARRYPGTTLLGEEMSVEDQQRLLSDTGRDLWCLDPLDGTSNFAGDFPYFAISLALLRDGEAVLGIVLDPVRDECFAAEKGSGAWLNGRPLHPSSNRTRLADCLALVDLKRLPPAYLSRLGGDAPYRSQRNLGSVALDWCWLAAGRGHLYLHGGQRLWDHSSGRLIASEAGVASRLFAPGGGTAPEGPSLEPRMAVAAANPMLFRQWIDWLRLPA